MKIYKKERRFKVGINNIILKEVAKISLNQNEMITFVSGKTEYDIVKKNWGYYATPSINKRLKLKGFKTALVINKQKNLYIMLVDKDKIKAFNKYCKEEHQKKILWLDEIKNNKKLSNL